MGGFWNTLGQVGQGIAQGVANQSPLGQGVYQSLTQQPKPKDLKGSSDALAQVAADDMQHVILPQAGTFARYNSPSTPGVATPVNPEVTGDVGAPAQAPWSPPPVTPAPQVTSGSDQSTAGAQSQWGNNNTSQQSPVGNILQGLAGKALGLRGGSIVTQPTLAKIGEHGPEAVVPLTPRAGNKLQPDLLEGHITPAKVPGVRYSRYRSYSRI